ncbi:hypothetical protein [Paragemmobacter straminiformis]|uniref:Uncharacterized protein n=1 Tax=Paragemmobacter straminiformis TaxID=2045119 RepID=A0A842I647_9RHOB|nr:hypothetical protein [Gemmobacter straminiformis]MBC2834534.1 hypothetical protein [Gemmobacter straminiformis]
MPDMVLRVPLGPTVVLRGTEASALFRHRYMLFLYIGAAGVGLLGSVGTWGETPPEIQLSLAVLQVMAGVLVMVLLVWCQRLLAHWTGRPRSVHLGVLVFAATATAVLTAEVCDRDLLGLEAASTAILLSQFVFYAVLMQLMLSVLLQFTLPRMLADLRRLADGDEVTPDETQAGSAAGSGV